MSRGQQAIAAMLRRRLASLAMGSAAPWHSSLSPVAEGHLNWLELRLDGNPPFLVCAFADELPGLALPRHWPTPDGRERVPVRSLRAPRCLRQGGGTANARNTSRAGGSGAVTAIVQRQGNAERLFALSAAHVLAVDGDARLGDDITIDGRLSGSLFDWLPLLGDARVETSVDAGIAEISAAQARDLRQHYAHLAPRATSSAFHRDQPVRIERCAGPLAGRLLGSLWTGWVDAPDNPGAQDYLLLDGLTYQAETPGTRPGDSGSALVDEDGRLLGLHCAGSPDSGADWNAIGCPIETVLEQLGCEMPATRSAAAAPKPAANPPPRPLARARNPAQPPRAGDAPPRPSANEDALARTLWGEARRERQPAAIMEAVAHVVFNRVGAQSWWGRTIAEVCRQPYQFPCWDPHDPSIRELLRVTAGDPVFDLARDTARRAIDGTLGADPTQGATHYYAVGLHLTPPWAAGRSHLLQIGRHRFYKDID